MCMTNFVQWQKGRNMELLERAEWLLFACIYIYIYNLVPFFFLFFCWGGGGGVGDSIFSA